MLETLRKPKKRILLVSTIAISAAGCMTAWKRLDVPASVDLSTSDKTAVILGSRSGMNGLDCYIGRPSLTRELIVDAGNQTIEAYCYNWAGEAGARLDQSGALLTFEAQQNHEYVLVGYSTCMGCGKRSKLGYEHVDLVDKTDGNRLIVREKLGGYNRVPNHKRVPNTVATLRE
jgi:hypothetical protein